MKKIAFLIGYLNVGGAEQLLTNIAINIDKNQYEPIVITIKGLGPLEEKLVNNDIKVYCLAGKRKVSLKVMINLYRILKEEKIDIINSHSFNGQFFGAICGKLLNIKTYNTEHTVFENIAFHQRILKKFLAKINTKIIACSEAVYDSLIEHNIYNDKNMIIIDNGVDINMYSKRNAQNIVYLKNKLRIEGKLVLITVGSIREEKNHLQFLNLLKDINNKNIVWIVVGDGYKRNDLENEIKNNNMQDTVILLGNKHDVWNYLSIADIFVLPSKYEGLSLAMLEAMACGLATICTDVGSNSKVIENGVNGYIIKLNEFKQFEDKIKYLYNNENILEEMKRNNVIKVKDNYNFNQTISKYQNCFENIK